VAGAAGPLRTEERWLLELQLWVVSCGASAWLIDLEPYESCRVAGLVKSLRIDPTNGVIEALIADGTGEVVAQWSIRRPTPELSVAPGTGVVLEGIAAVGPDQELILKEPRYESVGFPAFA
jgi:hypothetical protein